MRYFGQRWVGWLFKGYFWGFCFWPFIWYKEEHPSVWQVNHEEEHIKQQFRGWLIGYYIRYIADRRLIQLGLKGNYGIKENPLEWLEHLISSKSHDNFFETVVTEYSADGLAGGDWGWE